MHTAPHTHPASETTVMPPYRNKAGVPIPRPLCVGCDSLVGMIWHQEIAEDGHSVIVLCHRCWALGEVQKLRHRHQQ